MATNQRSRSPIDRTLAPMQSAQAASGGPVFQLLFEALLRRIRQGDWRPGERLPSIRQIAEELSASAGAVREALRSLQALGLIQIEHGRGVFVTARVFSSDLLGKSQAEERASLVALAEARQIVEPELAALAAERRAEAQLSVIMELTKLMQAQAHFSRAFVELDRRLHWCIAQAACNQPLFEAVVQIMEIVGEHGAISTLKPGVAASEVRYHLLIAEALNERNGAQARLLMRLHLKDLFGTIGAFGDERFTVRPYA